MKAKLLLGVLVLSAAMVGCSGEEAPTDVATIQKEAKSEVPANLGTVPPEKATEGAMTFGAKKGGG